MTADFMAIARPRRRSTPSGAPSPSIILRSSPPCFTPAGSAPIWAVAARRSAPKKASPACAGSSPGSPRPIAAASTTIRASKFLGERAAMMLSDEQLMIRDMARNFAAARLEPFAADWDREARFPAEAIAEMGRLGLMGMLVPESEGGSGADHVAYALALEEIAAGDGASSTIMSVQNSVGCMPLLK